MNASNKLPREVVPLFRFTIQQRVMRFSKALKRLDTGVESIGSTKQKRCRSVLRYKIEFSYQHQRRKTSI